MGQTDEDKIVTAEDNTDYEKLSYDPYTYRRVQRIRKNGLQHGVTVPKLKYQLTQPEKRRMPLFIMGILASIVFITVLVLAGVLYSIAIRIRGTFNVVEMFTNLFDPIQIVRTLGLSILGGIGIVLYYILLLLILAVPVILIFYMYKFVRTLFALSTCSKEEFAKGHRVMKYIVIFMALGVICLGVAGTILFAKFTLKAKVIITIIFVLLAALMLAYSIIMIMERVKSSKWFDTLDDERKKDYLMHDKALARSKARAERHARIDTGFWR